MMTQSNETTSHHEVPVTVVIPFFNGHDTISRAIRSITCQPVCPAEIIVVDDGSPTPLEREQIEATGNIEIVRHHANRGIPSARNTGILAASHEWIAFLDQDDEFAPGKLARQWAAVVDSGYDKCRLFWGRILLHEATRTTVHPPLKSAAKIDHWPELAVRELVLNGNIVPFITVLLNRELLRRYGLLDEEIKGGGDDYELVLRLAAEGVKFVNVDIRAGPHAYSAVHHYTGRNYSNALRFLEDGRRIVEKLSDRFAAIDSLKAQKLAKIDYGLARYWHCSGELTEARLSYKRALARRPMWWRPWAGLALTYTPRALHQAMTAIRLRLRGGRREGLSSLQSGRNPE